MRLSRTLRTLPAVTAPTPIPTALAAEDNAPRVVLREAAAMLGAALSLALLVNLALTVLQIR